MESKGVMRKTKKLIAGIIMAGVILLFFAKKAEALIWTYVGDYSGDINTELVVGYGNVGDPERYYTDGSETVQPPRISGAGTQLPSGYDTFRVDFDFNGSTWDSYNESLGKNTGTGYYDVFAVVLSEYGYYWDSAINHNIHPLEDNAQLVLGLAPYDSTPGPDDSYWGGDNYSDHARDDDDSNVTLDFAVDPEKEYYLSIFMQTMGDENYSSWGTFSNVSVDYAMAPEPGTLWLLGSGLLGLAGFRCGRRK